MKRRLRRGGNQLVRVVLLVAIIAASGVGLGFAAGYPLSRIEFDDSDAVRLDHTRLAGEIDPKDAVVLPTDLPLTWSPGDPAVGAFGLLGLGFCGQDVELPRALSAREVAVYADAAGQGILISEAVRVDRWQSARSYVDDVEDSLEGCDEFYRTDLQGGRTQVKIGEAPGDSPITDHVSRTFSAEDGSSVQVWSLMAVGDVVVALQHVGPQKPQEGFLSDLEDKILIRIDPADFAPGGIPATTTTLLGDPGDPGDTPTSEPAGAADETEAIPEGDAPDGSPDDGGAADGGAADESVGTGD